MIDFDDDSKRSREQAMQIRALEATLAKTRLIAARDELAKSLDGMKIVAGLNVADPEAFRQAAGIAVESLKNAIEAANRAIAQSQYLAHTIRRIPSEE